MNINNPEVHQTHEMTLKELIQKTNEWVALLKTKWWILVLASFLGCIIGFGYAYNKKISYTASLTFVLEDEKSGGSGLAGALGLVNSLGVDVAGGSLEGAFTGANLMELMKSRRLVQKALLQPISPQNNKQSLADYYIKITGLGKIWEDNPSLRGIHFDPLADPNNFTITKDSLLGVLWKRIIAKNGVLSVSQKDKKISIVTVESKSEDEQFSKIFAETITQVVSDFYVETRTKKAKQNFEILQRQTDSVRQELNMAITGVAIANDNTYNLNPAFNILRTPSTKKQIDVQVNTAVLTQLIPNLEMAKVSLRKETPLIQIIDTPILPLMKEQPGKIKTMILFGLISSTLTVLVLILGELLKKSLRK